MGSSRQVIRIDAEVNASLGNLNKVVTQLKEGLSKGVTQVDMSKGIGKSISGLIRTFQTEYDEFSRLTKNGVLNMDDSGPAITSAKKLLRVFDELQDVMSGIESKDANALKKLFPNGFDKNISDLGKELDKVSQKIKNLSTAKTQKLGLEAEVERLQAELEQLKNKIGQPEQLEINVQQAEQRIERIDQWLTQLQEKAQRGIEFKLRPVFKKKDEVLGGITGQIEAKKKEISQAREALRNTYGAGIGKNERGQFTYEGKTSGEWAADEAFGTKEEREKAKAVNKFFSKIQGKEDQFTMDQEAISKKQQELQQLELQLVSTRQRYEQLGQTLDSLGNLGLEELANLGKEAGFSPEQIESITKALRERAKAQEALNQAQQNQADLPKNQQAVEQKSADIEAKKNQIVDLEKTISGLTEKLDLSDLSKKLGELGIDISPDLLKSEEGAQQVREQLEKLDNEKLSGVRKALQDLGLTAQATDKNFNTVKEGIKETEQEVRELTRAEQDMKNLQDQMLDFFSITNTVQLFKDAVKDAFNTVKELDAVMTQTAVVTDFSVSDMWDKLPEYSANANKLGASISSLYQATTLYYQQGLETEAAMGVGIETMKMARIAGMEAAEATQAMTAALRGFNMEVNETNATRVNDVYSELAAITAADTEQIATAMTKTASIAASANMEFETTAALLAQIIETTQEAPETAGTAMKTIIARFTEVKSLFSEGQLTGKDEEGEEIDINKIDKALKTVGISLKDFLNGSKGIDDVFLELASKWDTLDLATQRYIATTAAGSRQQSRFIAMMSDYERTMELVSAANNSAGASQKQFDKTQESLEAKLQKLKNAWDQFVMGIANSDVIKGAVDLLTKILDTVNSLIDKLSGGNGLVKGVLSLGAAFGGLKIGESALNSFLKGFASKPIGQMIGLVSPDEDKNKPQEPQGFFGKVWNKIRSIPLKKNGQEEVEAEAIAEEVVEESPVETAENAAERAEDAVVDVQIQRAEAAAERAEAAAARAEQIANGGDGGSDSNLGDAVEEVLDGDSNERTGEGASSGRVGEGAGEIIEEGAENTVGDALDKLRDKIKEKGKDLFKGVFDKVKVPFDKLRGIFSTGISKVLGPAVSSKAVLLLSNIAMGATAALAAVAVVAIAKAIDRAIETAKEKRERLENQVKFSKEAEKNARSTRDSLKADISSLRNLENGFEKLVRGTSEWKEQLIQANQQAIELLEKYEGLQLETGAYGQLTISEESYQKIQEQLLERAYKAQAQQASASLELAILDYKEEWRLARQSANKYQTSQIYLGQSSTGVAASTTSGATVSGNGELYQDVIIENKTDSIFSLSDKQARTYLSALADAGINSTNLNSREDQIRTILKSQGYSGDIDSLISSMSTLGEDFDKLSTSALAASTRIEGLEYSFFFNAAQNRKNKDFADDVATNYLDFIYSSSGGLSKYKQQVAEGYKDWSKNDLLEEYASEMGYYYSGGMVYYSKDQMDAPIQFGEDDEQIVNTLRSTLADLEISEEATNKLDELSLTSNQLEAYQTIFGSQAPSLGEWIKLDEVDEAYQALGLKEKDIYGDNGSLTALGGELQRILNKNTEQVQKKYADVFKQVGRVYTTNGIITYTSTTVDRLIEKFGEDFADRTSSAIQALSPLDSSISDTILSNLLKLEDAEEFKAASDLISDVDWSNPIKAAEQITQAMITGDEATKTFAETLSDTAKSFLGVGSQVRYFIESTDFSAVYGEIQKVIDKSGELTAVDILEIADDYDSLSKILENTDISAAGLAKTLELIGDGSLQIYQLTDAVMAAFSGFSSLESVVAETLKTIEEFDPGINETDVIDFLEKHHKILTENIEKGYYGNSQNIEFLDFILGPDWREGKTGKEIEQEIVRLTGLFEGEDGGLQKMVQNMFSGKKYSGEGYEQGKPVFDPSKLAEMDSLEAQAYIAETQNVSDVMAGIILTYLKNLDVGFGQAMEKQDRNLAADKFWTKQKEQAGEGPITIDQSEIDAFAETWKLTEEEKENYINKLIESGAKITQYRKDGKLRNAKEIVDELNTAYGIYKWGKTEGYYKDDRFISEKYNEQEVKQTLSRENFSQEEQEQIFKDMIANATENGEMIEIETMLSNGDLTTIEVTSLEDYESQIRELETELEQNTIAEVIQKGFVGAFSELATETMDINIQIGDETFTITADPSQAEAVIDAFYAEVEGETAYINISGQINEDMVKFLESLGVGDIRGALQNSGIEIKNNADGTKNSPTTYDSLVSEEGPELIYRANGTAYLSGLNGPEVTKIHRGDTVYTAEETKQIFKNRGKTIPNFMAGTEGEAESVSTTGIDWFGESNSSSSSETGSNSLLDFDSTKALKELLEKINGNVEDMGQETGSLTDQIIEEKTSLDRLYNLVSQIEESTRQRERLERRYETLLEDSDSTVNQLIDVSKEQLAALEEEKKLQEAALKGRQAEIDALVAQNSNMAQYVSVETNDSGDQVPRIDWDKINAIGNDDERKKVEEYIGKLEEKFDALAEIEKALWDIEDEVKEIESRGKDEYLEIEEIIKDAVEFHYQNQIDKLTEIDNSINETNSSMMQAIQDSLAQQRQERDNAKTEEDLAEKERQLQYLKQDTSGANALEIMELEKELKEAQEDYTDTLIDQKLSAIQQQNDQASQERQMQIQILQNQLNYLISSGNIYDIVNDLRTNGIDVKGVITGSELEGYLQTYVGSLNLSSLGTTDWWDDFNKKLKAASGYENLNKQLENLINEGILKVGMTITFTDGNGNTLTGVLQEGGSVKVGDMVYDNVYQQANDTYATNETQGTRIEKEPEQDQKPPEPEIPQWVKELENSKGFGYDNVAKKDYLPVMEALKFLGYGGNSFDPKAGIWDWDAKQALRDFQAANNLPVSGEMWTDRGFYGASPSQVENGIATRKALLKAVKQKLGLTQFKTGGVADFTGPAWLDGTKSRPEIILNQQDSRNFIQLKDILGSILKGNHYSSSSTENNGDTVYDIDINVEKLEREVDLDTISNYVERKITETARYRNNNAVKISR